jgi:hypothetical protein
MNIEREDKSDGSRRYLFAGIIVLVGGLVAFSALQYLMPDVAIGVWGVSHKGLHYWEQALFHKRLQPIPADLFVSWFRWLLFIIAGGYALLVYAARHISRTKPGPFLVLIGALGLIVAVFCPPSLSSDSFSYVTYARMPVIYHLNPYFHSPGLLMAARDNAVYILPKNADKLGHEHLKWDVPTVYGPIWSSLTILVVAFLKNHSLYSQVLAMRLIEIAALMLTACSAKLIAGRYAPEYETMAFLGVGLNPFLIIEGIAGAHNDLLMISLLMLCAAYNAHGKPIAGSIALGLAIGIKFITVAALPWIILDHIRMKKEKNLSILAVMAILAITPTIIGYVPYWHGLGTLSGVFNRSQQSSMFGPPPLAAIWWPIIRNHVTSPHLRQMAQSLSLEFEIVAIFVGLTVWLVRNNRIAAWYTAWVILAVSMMIFLVRLWFPWYLIWSLPFTMLRKHTASAFCAAACFGLAFISTYLYTVKSPLVAQDILSYFFVLLVIILLAINYIHLLRRKNSLK